MTESSGKPGEDIFEIDRIRRLVELMNQFDLSEVDLRQNEQRIRLRRGADPDQPVYVGSAAPPAAASAPTPSPPAPAAASPPTATEAVADGPHIHIVKSPMVGTFYARPNPESPTFVKVGDHVSAETTICIIEAMKTFNEISAEVSGKVVAVLVENEASVDFDRALFKIDTR